MAQKKYRVNESEMFNLDSMRTHLLVVRDEAIDKKDWELADKMEARIEEVEKLMEQAWCVGALVDWPTLARIREIKNERCLQRYATCLAAGMSEELAAGAFTD